MIYLSPVQLACYHFAQAEHLEGLKRISANNPTLFYQCANHLLYNETLAHRYKAMTAWTMNPPYTKVVGATEKYAITRSLPDLLLDGGYILYVRHGEANVGEDQPNLNFQNCLTQRNLSEEGKRQAVAYGEALRNLRIPVMYPVLASPFCRNRETANLAFGEENVQVDPFWIKIYQLSGGLIATEEERILNSLQSAIEIQPPLGRNKVIVAHSFPKGIGLGEIPDMGTVVVKPHGQGNGYEVIAKVSLGEMMSLLE